MTKLYMVAAAPHNLNNGSALRRHELGHRVRFLLSYWYYQQIDLRLWFATRFPGEPLDIFVDGGGFSADSQGGTISFSEYYNWLREYEDLFLTYSNFDVIGDQAGTDANQILLESMGLNPFPVFTLQRSGADYDALRRYLDAGYEYIALGGCVPFAGATRKLMPHLVKCFQIASSYPTVFHGFGINTWEILKALPFYSADASSWASGMMYGSLRLFDRTTGRIIQVPLGDRERIKFAEHIIRDAGFDPDMFVNRTATYEHAGQLCGLSLYNMEQYLRRTHGTIFMPLHGRIFNLQPDTPYEHHFTAAGHPPLPVLDIDRSLDSAHNRSFGLRS